MNINMVVNCFKIRMINKILSFKSKKIRWNAFFSCLNHIFIICLLQL